MIGIWIWTRGLLRRRRARLAATSVGVAAAVALLAGIGIFLAVAQSSMTDRAARSVAVDWQVQVQPAAAPGSVLDLVRTASGVRTAVPVGFAQSSGFAAAAADTTATTGPGMVLGLPDGYRTEFPTALRTLTGADSGVLVAQQTAANLHVKPGDIVEIGRAGLPRCRWWSTPWWTCRRRTPCSRRSASRPARSRSPHPTT